MSLASPSVIKSPVFIIGAPRSGTTLLFALLASSQELWSLYTEGEIVFHKYVHPSRSDWRKGNRLDALDVSAELQAALQRDLYRRAMNVQRWFPALSSEGYIGWHRTAVLRRQVLGKLTHIAKPGRIRLLEKTPKNSLRVPFLYALFPDAKFIFLARDGRSNVSSLLEGWQSGQFRSYELPVPLHIHDCPDIQRWSFVLPPGWEQFTTGRLLAEICAFQYVVCNDIAQTDLAALPQDHVMRIRYEELVDQPQLVMCQACDFLAIGYQGGLKSMTETLPVLNSLSPPSAHKWQHNAQQINTILPLIRPTMERLGYPVG